MRFYRFSFLLLYIATLFLFVTPWETINLRASTSRVGYWSMEKSEFKIPFKGKEEFLFEFEACSVTVLALEDRKADYMEVITFINYGAVSSLLTRNKLVARDDAEEDHLKCYITIYFPEVVPIDIIFSMGKTENVDILRFETDLGPNQPITFKESFHLYGKYVAVNIENLKI